MRMGQRILYMNRQEKQGIKEKIDTLATLKNFCMITDGK